MKTIPVKCKDINAVGTFCDCIADAEESVDVAARAFCRRANTGSNTNVTGDELTELKKAINDLESD
jgi:hypothetical protein